MAKGKGDAHVGAVFDKKAGLVLYLLGCESQRCLFEKSMVNKEDYHLNKVFSI